MVRAFGRRTVLGYEAPWNCRTFSADVHVEVSHRDLDAKVAALGEYQSQASRPYIEREYLESWVRFRGLQGGYAAAEAYELIHLGLEAGEAR